MSTPLISNVSDTARWVATYRAWETARPDALFHDPYASKLAGERGAEIARSVPQGVRNGWSIVVRTKIIDDLILQCVSEGCDCVVNLAAGFDARPYRMKLPANLLWVEADLPAMIAEKQRLLVDASPACRLARHPVDLSEAAARAEFLDEVQRHAAKALVITEGLITYLPDEVVRALAVDLHRRSAVEWWIADFFSPSLLRRTRKLMGASLAQAPLVFAPADGVRFFEASGWKTLDIRSIIAAAKSFGRLPFHFLYWLISVLTPEPDPRRFGRANWYGVVRLQR
jgi:methyltransferase (TIGR00027 family)